jgi:hypothetical protein
MIASFVRIPLGFLMKPYHSQSFLPIHGIILLATHFYIVERCIAGHHSQMTSFSGELVKAEAYAHAEVQRENR